MFRYCLDTCLCRESRDGDLYHDPRPDRDHGRRRKRHDDTSLLTRWGSEIDEEATSPTPEFTSEVELAEFAAFKEFCHTKRDLMESPKRGSGPPPPPKKSPKKKDHDVSPEEGRGSMQVFRGRDSI